MNLNKVDKDLKDLNKTLGQVTTVLGGVAVVSDYVSRLTEDKSDWVVVPELYLKGFQIRVDDAVKILNDEELKSVRCELNIAEANPRYRNCVDCQVIETRPRAKQKVPKGTLVYVKYITQEVIDASREMFVESELQKEQLRLEKNIRRDERKGRIKDIQSGVLNKIESVPKHIAHKKSKEDVLLIEVKEEVTDEQALTQEA